MATAPGSSVAPATSAERDEPIAVVGLSCRFPGAPGPAAYWRLLTEGRSAVSATVPGGRPGLPAGSVPRPAGFLDGVDRFDAEFFGITPREAAAADPQQRLALELAWEALENAGIVPAALRDGDTAVYIGAMWDDYARLTQQQGPDAVTHHTITGVSRGIIANRISYVLGLRGPSVVVDSGQSSSLVAVRFACESLLRGDCSAALAGGVSLALAPEGFTVAERFGALSPTGTTYAFDARADGYVRGEGGGLVVLKTLRRALADGDRVHAVIRGGAVNNDGGGRNLTAPHGAAQEEVLRRAYRRAGVDPAAVRFVELHGTGTPLGDPVEAAALGAVLGSGAGRPGARPLLTGSAKTGIGHLEGAAGIAGLIKTVLCLRERTLVPSLNFESPNPAIPLDDLGLAVNDRLTPLTAPGDGPLYAGISSFGMGGTNCHLVLADWTPDPATAAGSPATAAPARSAPTPLPVSARTPAALAAQAAALYDHLTGRPGLRLDDVAHSLATTRTHFEHRALLLADGRDDALAALHALAGGAGGPRAVTGRVRPGGLAFLFTGQGSQRPGMGRELYGTYPAFAQGLDAAFAALDPHLERPLREVMFAAEDTPEAALLDTTGWTQPALFAYETAMFRLLEHFGVAPAFVMGHSVGELAAAHAAGVLSLDDAAALVAARGRLMQALPARGAMVSVQASEAELLPELAALTDRVSIAALNGPAATVVAGDEAAVLAVADRWRQAGRKTKRLRVSHAFHSPHMEPVLDAFRDVAAALSYHAPRIPVVSNLTGLLADPREIALPDHWVRHARDGVRFHDGVTALAHAGARSFLEVGPDAVLAAMGRDCLPAEHVPAAAFPATARRSRPEVPTLLRALAELHVRGVRVDWDKTVAGRAGRRVELPTYPFQRTSHWLTAAAADRPAPPAEPAPMAEPVPPPAAAATEPTAPAAPAAGFAARLAASPPAGAGRMLDDLVRTQVAAVMGYADADAVDVTRTFKELGFDSLSGVELCDRLSEATGTRLPATLVFDHPTTEDVVRHLRTELLGAPDGAGSARPATTTATASGTGSGTGTGTEDDPIVIVGVGCRYPGGVGSAEDLWELVVSGVDAVSGFPVDRGWDVEGLFDPSGERAGST
uniref:type I polyketide synthase n=1 Tax=Streptomyces sp. HPF1205 TaxID=2873262 RepID=UPI001CEC41E0